MYTQQRSYFHFVLLLLTLLFTIGCDNSPNAETPDSQNGTDDGADSEANNVNEDSDSSAEDDATDSSATDHTDEVPVDGTPVEIHGDLHVTGAALLDEYDRPVALHGQGFGWDNWWPQYYNKEVVKWLRDDWCVDIVRPAMGIEPDGAYLQNPEESKARIKAVVNAAIEEGIYVIIDWHAHEFNEAEAIGFFSEMAETYGEYPNVIYEIFNEPKQVEWSEVKAYAEAVIAAIREHDPNNIVIVGTPEWDQRIDLVVTDPITQFNNLVYAVHFYAETHTIWLRTRVEAALAAGTPVFVSESSGADYAGQGPSNYTEWEAWFELMDNNNISWVNYAIADKEGETISILEPGTSGAGGWTDDDLTESGEYIRDVFRAYCGK